jgi:hypothetical protein
VKEEPLWRVALNWGCVFWFLSLPALVILSGVFSIEIFPPSSDALRFLSTFHFSVSALVAAMAGLNSFDKYKENGKAEAKK